MLYLLITAVVFVTIYKIAEKRYRAAQSELLGLFEKKS